MIPAVRRAISGPCRRCGPPLLASALTLALCAAPVSGQEAGREGAGHWTEPFEEGGAGQPRCAPGQDAGEGSLVCKPAAQAAAVLPDGRVFYFNGLEGQENAEGPSAVSLAPASRNSQSRVLDLRLGSPQFIVPDEPRGGQVNPNVRPGHRSEEDPFGLAGVPGRGGDGPVGSGAARLGVPEQHPTSSPDDAAANDGDMFCADVTTLPDGRVLILGGTDWYHEPALMDRHRGDPADVGIVELEGLRNASIFDPETDSFTAGAAMKYGRWCPGSVVLGDGRIFVAGGVTKLIKTTQLGGVRRTETYDPATDAWAENGGLDAETSLPLTPRLFLAPNGKVFYSGAGQAGPSGLAADQALFGVWQFFDPGTNEWEVAGVDPLGFRGSPAVVPLMMEPPYDRMTLLTYGGTLGPPPGGYLAVPYATLTTVGADGSVTSAPTGSLAHARWFPSGVLLPDGSVLAVGGAEQDGAVTPGLEVAVRTPELYDPATGQWRAVAPHARDRTHHHSALLLPDMRVLLGGHAPVAAHHGGAPRDQGERFANNHRDPSFEIWSPPYLFRGERPRITEVQAGVDYGERFSIRTPQAGEIESVVLMRVPSPQQVTDSDQRAVRLDFTRTADGTLEALAPPHGRAQPPGYHYLVINRATQQGPVPSVARMVRLGDTDPTEALQPYPDDAPAPIAGSATPVDDTVAAGPVDEAPGAAMVRDRARRVKRFRVANPVPGYIPSV